MVHPWWCNVHRELTVAELVISSAEMGILGFTSDEILKFQRYPLVNIQKAIENGHL